MTHIPYRIGISERPDSANNRLEVGHWEVDLAVSQQNSSSLHVLLDRKTRYAKLTLLPTRESKVATNATIKRLNYVPKLFRKTITYDNGPENAFHTSVNHVLGTKSYFCRPHRSWEKGTIENTIGIVRRFLPKSTDFSKVSIKQIKKIEKWLNNRPRKCLNFLTPYEAFKAKCCT